MLNQRPIFLVGFARGGSNLLLNLLRSHPKVCSPRGELHEIFVGKDSEPKFVRALKIGHYLPILIRERRHIFSPRDWSPRNALSASSQRRIDHILFEDKLKARGIAQNRFKTEGSEYTNGEIRHSRLLCKNLNGTIFLTPQLSNMYPDAQFITLVRDPYAICESHLRRGFTIEAIATAYRDAATQILQDTQRANNRLYHYESLIRAPVETAQSVYQQCGLDWNELTAIRMETKLVMDSQGGYTHSAGASDKTMVWYSVDEFANHFVKDANIGQKNKLSAEQQAIIQNIAGEAATALGYDI